LSPKVNASYASAVTKNNTNPSTSLPPNDHITTVVSSCLNEEKERSKRQLNLIVHNLKEPTSEDGATCKKEDIKQTNNLLQNHMEVSPTVTNAVRLGKRRERPRLLRVTVSSKSEKATVLRNTFKLRRGQETKNIFISPDMTHQEQELNKKLHLDVKELNRDGNRYQIKKWQDSAAEGAILIPLPALAPPSTLNFNDSIIHTSNQENNLESLSCDNVNHCVPSSDPSHSTVLKVISLNCCSLRSVGKRTTLKALVDENKPDIIIGCKTHLDETYTNNEVFPLGYSIIRKDRCCGGVFLVISQSISYVDTSIATNAEMI